MWYIMQLQFLHYRSVGCLVWFVCHDLDGECESMWVNVWVRSGWRITSTSDESVECLGCCQQSSQGGSGPEALERRSRHFEISNREEQDLKQNDSRPIMTYPHPPIPCETLCFFLLISCSTENCLIPGRRLSCALGTFENFGTDQPSF